MVSNKAVEEDSRRWKGDQEASVYDTYTCSVSGLGNGHQVT